MLIVLNNAKTHKSVLENLCNFASNNYFQGRKIVKIWEEYFSNIKNSSLHEEIKNIGTATILGLAVKQNIINNPKQAQEEIQQALKIDLPVELWNLMTLANKNKKATYPQKNPFIFQLQDERILCTNSKKKTLWSFPPYQIQIMTNFLFFPRKNRVYVGYGRFLLGINVETGSTVERYILPPHIFHLHRIDKKSFAIEVKGFSFRESRTILFNVNKKKIKKDEPVLDTLLTTMQKISETNRAFINEGFDIFRTDFKKNIWHSVNLPLNKFLKIAETLCLKDKTNEVNYYVKALILHEMGSKEQANKIIDLLLRNNQLTFSEHVTLGMYSNFFGIPKWDDLFFDKAKILQVKTFHNPNLDYASVAAIHYLMKKLAEHYFDIGKEENPKMFAKCFLILENIRKLYAFTEGDYYSYLSLHRWALKNNKKELALTFQNLAEKSYDNGGDSFAPEKSIVLADMLIPFVSIVVFLFFALVLYYWYRARQTRIADLKSVGYGSVVLRNVAFALNPIKRARYTFINYTNVKERVLLFALFTTGIAGMLVFNACIMYIGKLATVPYNLADGYLGTENSIAYLKKLENKVDSLSWNLLMAEARYQKKEYLSAEKHWKKVNQAIAYNNLGCLLSSKDKDEAMRYFEKNILCDSMYSMVAKINISILKKEKLDNDIIKKLPTIYQNHLNILPGKCLLLFCDYKLLQKSQIDETETVFFMLINLFSFSTLFSEIFSISMLDIASGVYYFLYFVMFIMIIGFFSAERKISEISFGMNKTDSFLLLFGHVLPGTIWVVKRQAIRSLGIFTVVIGCYIFLFLHYYDGGILRNIAMPAFPFIQSVADITPSYIYYLNNISVGILFVLFLCSMYVSSLKDVYSRLRQQ